MPPESGTSRSLSLSWCSSLLRLNLNPFVPSALSLTGTRLSGSIPVTVIVSTEDALPPAGIPSAGFSTKGSDRVPLPPKNPGEEVVFSGSGPARCDSPVLSLFLMRGMRASRRSNRRRMQQSHQKSMMLLKPTPEGLTSSPSQIPSPSSSGGVSFGS